MIIKFIFAEFSCQSSIIKISINILNLRTIEGPPTNCYHYYESIYFKKSFANQFI